MSLLGLGVVNCEATTIVILVTKDRIVVAADSAGTRIGPSGERTTSYGECKIHKGPRAAFLAAGWVKVDGVSAYDVFPGGEKYLNGAYSMSELYSFFFNETVLRIRHDGDGPRRDLEAGYVGWEAGRPAVAIGYFEEEGARSQPIIPGLILRTIATSHFDQTWLWTCERACNQAAVLGLESHIDLDALKAALARNPKEAEMAHLAEEAVNAQAKDQSGLVGGPVDILVIDRKGARWYKDKVKEACR